MKSWAIRSCAKDSSNLLAEGPVPSWRLKRTEEWEEWNVEKTTEPYVIWPWSCDLEDLLPGKHEWFDLKLWSHAAATWYTWTMHCWLPCPICSMVYVESGWF